MMSARHRLALGHGERRRFIRQGDSIADSTFSASLREVYGFWMKPVTLGPGKALIVSSFAIAA